MGHVYYDIAVTCFGEVLVGGDGEFVNRLTFQGGKHASVVGTDWKRDRRAVRLALDELNAYCEGAIKSFSVGVKAEGTPFQEAVWTALRSIPFGETITYAELARRVSRPAAVRAVGAANAKNPVSVFLPCHRVIGHDGGLTGYGGGLNVKAALLQHERNHC